MKTIRRILFWITAAMMLYLAGNAAAGQEWTHAVAWITALFWMVACRHQERVTHRWSTAYVAAVGRNVGEYARGLSDGARLNRHLMTMHEIRQSEED